MTIRIAVVGLGKIARDQHLPAIAATDGITLAAVASRNARLDDVPSYSSLDALIASDTAFDAVALCTPPQIRRAEALRAIESGRQVLLEKPPGATVGELAPLVAAARARSVTLFASWHSRFALAVERCRDILSRVEIQSVEIVWKEDVRIWHPGQAWIFEPGGLGVFDPGINAISILTRILPRPVFVTRADLDFPSNKAAPIAAELELTDARGLPIRASFDFLQTGPQTWDIRVETDEGVVLLSSGGSTLSLDGIRLEPRGTGEAEYPALYRHFVELVGRCESDVDLAPLAHVADAFMLGNRRIVAPFVD